MNWANTSIELSRQNINRFVRILFPPKPEVLSNMCQQGFDDALQFLHRNNLISCTRCLAVQSTFVVQEAIPEAQEEYDPECTDCQQHRNVNIFCLEKNRNGLFTSIEIVLIHSNYRMH